MTYRRAFIWSSSASLAAVCGAAEPPEKRPEIPAAVVFALRAENASSWRTHEPTRRWTAALSGRASGAPERLQDAWAELAATLGMEDGPAFDALLGRSAVVCLAGEGAWGILGAVSAEDARRLESKLDPAPRGFEDGRAVMLVERGRFRLTKAPAEGDALRMVLTPGESAGPIELTTACAGELAAAARKADAAWFWRSGAATASGTLRREERGWSAEFQADGALLGLTPEGCRTLAKTAARVEEAEAGDGPLLEVVGRAPEVPALESQAKFFAALLAQVRIVPPPAAALGPTVMLRVEAPGEERSTPGWLIGVEVKDRAAAAAGFDAMMVGVLDLAWRLSSEPKAASRSFKAEIERAKGDPEAVRLVEVGESKGSARGGTLAWTTVRGGAGEGGWWFAQYLPGERCGDQAERRLQERARAAAGRDRGAEVLSVRLRPARIWRLLGGAGEVETAAVMKEIERAELRVHAEGDGLRGEARITATPAAEPMR